MYREACQHSIIVRRYSGSPRIPTDVDVAGNAQLYAAEKLGNGVVQGDTRVIVLVEDIEDSPISLPLTTNDKVVVDGRELAILVPGTRKALDGTLIAYELQVRG